MVETSGRRWSIADASELYEVERWGKGFFSICEEGNLLVHPDRNPARSIDMEKLVNRLKLRGLELPVLLRFDGILEDRLREIHQAFSAATKEYGYQGNYSCVYPIKVNQQRQVVEKIVEYGREFGFGLEAGSKPELLAVVALTDPAIPIVCNGFKDAEFIEMAMLAQKMGRRVIPVVEKYTELNLILRMAERVGVRPSIGMRVKLASRGAGRWQKSGGYRSKFGLTVSEILRGLDELHEHDMADCFTMLHFHLGSQITNIRQVKSAINEAARVYVDLHRRGAGLTTLDVGGGLGVDYDGSQTNFESSMNYTLQEYANDVVYHIQAVCEETGIPHPDIISESGRAIAAYHSVLVFESLGVSGQGNPPAAVLAAEQETSADFENLPQDAKSPLKDLLFTYHDVCARNVLESYHDAQQALDTAINLFNTGHLPLDQRVISEDLFFAICRKIRGLFKELEYIPEELQGLDTMLSDTVFCNFSLFQSMPDSWAIGQLFPVMPIHRLDEQPVRHSVLCDITCDSDGKIDTFIDRRSTKRTLKLHASDGSPYYLAAFLTGAYQEILGDLHNLFGDTNAVHVDMNDRDEVVLEAIIKGDTVREVLSYVQFDEEDLINRVQRAVETAVQKNRLDHEQAGRLVKFYEDQLNAYTYLSWESSNLTTPQPGPEAKALAAKG
ncbi:MAG: biosynthetic arginine decarboxylase [Planctomycetaceae bacterium]|nr:biosynthetic arginine decarboxylase [Planctomycetaceae bacterium]